MLSKEELYSCYPERQACGIKKSLEKFEPV
jgi:hypothetical protein